MLHLCFIIVYKSLLIQYTQLNSEKNKLMDLKVRIQMRTQRVTKKDLQKVNKLYINLNYMILTSAYPRSRID